MASRIRVQWLRILFSTTGLCTWNTIRIWTSIAGTPPGQTILYAILAIPIWLIEPMAKETTALFPSQEITRV